MVKKRKARKADFPVTGSSGNVFADLGFAEPEEELTKAQLASHIRQVIERRRLIQVTAATLMGVDQPKVSTLLVSEDSCVARRSVISTFVRGIHDGARI